MNVRMQLANLKNNDQSTTEYINKGKRLADTLASIGQPLRDEEVISYLLYGLGEEYDSLVTSVTTHIDVVSLSDLYAHLLAFELRLEQRNPNL